jgi:outer membrane protein assembly factor BamB
MLAHYRPAAAALLIAIASTTALAENWPGWRGPQGDGSSQETGIPTTWSPEENIAWRVEVPGNGHASPVVWDDRIFVATCLEDARQRILLCYDRTSGKELWRRVVLEAPLEDKHVLNSFASSTPATDGKFVYVTFLDGAEMAVAAYDYRGQQQWLVRPGGFSSKHGYCSCPVLFEDLVIVNGDHDGDAYLVALDNATGSIRWKTDRENKTRSYVTPIIREINGRTQLILSGSKCVASYDPHNGQRHWIIDGPTEQFVASIVYNEKLDLLFLTAGFPELHMMAVRPDGSGNVTDTHIAWRTKKGASYVPSPAAVGDYFLVVSDGGVASCFDAASGKRLWMERIGTHYSSSPVVAEGLVYFTSDEGNTTVIRPGPKLDVVAENKLGEYAYASPAVTHGQLIFRGEKHLLAIGK